jgi:hypothetical protein
VSEIEKLPSDLVRDADSTSFASIADPNGLRCELFAVLSHCYCLHAGVSRCRCAFLRIASPIYTATSTMMIEAQMFADSLLANTAQSEEVWIDSQMGVLKSHEAESARRGMLGPDEYDQKYRSLSHTYYRREWFAQRTGANVRSLEVFDGCVPNYEQNRFRFGVMMRISQ